MCMHHDVDRSHRLQGIERERAYRVNDQPNSEVKACEGEAYQYRMLLHDRQFCKGLAKPIDQPDVQRNIP